MGAWTIVYIYWKSLYPVSAFVLRCLWVLIKVSFCCIYLWISQDPRHYVLYCVRQLAQISYNELENDTDHILVERKCLYSACLIKTISDIEQHCSAVFWTCEGLILPMICLSQVKFIWNFCLFLSKLWSIERYKILHMTPHAAAKYAKMGAFRQPGVELRQYEISQQLDLWVQNSDWNVFHDPCID